jgi:hypothetical protein
MPCLILKPATSAARRSRDMNFQPITCHTRIIKETTTNTSVASSRSNPVIQGIVLTVAKPPRANIGRLGKELGEASTDRFGLREFLPDIET